MFTIVQISLVLHITGIIILAGLTVASYTLSIQSWRLISTDRAKAIFMNSTTMIFGRLIGIGGLLTIITGFVMVSILREGVTAQIWFRIKMLLVVLIVLNGAIYARRQNSKLTRLLSSDFTDSIKLNSLKRNLNASFLLQLILFVIIFVLSIFRFG